MDDNQEKKWAELLRKAVQLGAGAYVSAEDRLQKTISTAQMPFTFSKEVLKDVLDNFMQSYSIKINAQIDFVPKKKEKEEEKK